MTGNTNTVGNPIIEHIRVTEGDADQEDHLMIPLDPETALGSLLQVDPHAEPVDDSR